MRKAFRVSTTRLRDNGASIRCPYQHKPPGQRPSHSHDLSKFSIIHLTTRTSNPLTCLPSGHAVPSYRKRPLLESLSCNRSRYGEMSSYPHLTRGPPLSAEPFDINKIPYGALRDAELMRLMEQTDDRMLMVLKARYPRCGPLQGIQATDVVHMVYYYRENEHCQAAAPWPQTLKEEWLLKGGIMEVLRGQ